MDSLIARLSSFVRFALTVRLKGFFQRHFWLSATSGKHRFAVSEKDNYTQ